MSQDIKELDRTCSLKSHLQLLSKYFSTTVNYNPKRSSYSRIIPLNRKICIIIFKAFYDVSWHKKNPSSSIPKQHERLKGCVLNLVRIGSVFSLKDESEGSLLGGTFHKNYYRLSIA